MHSIFFTWRSKFEPAITRSKSRILGRNSTNTFNTGIPTADYMHSEYRIGHSHLYGNLGIPAVRVPKRLMPGVRLPVGATAGVAGAWCPSLVGVVDCVGVVNEVV